MYLEQPKEYPGSRPSVISTIETALTVFLVGSITTGVQLSRHNFTHFLRGKARVAEFGAHPDYVLVSSSSA